MKYDADNIMKTLIKKCEVAKHRASTLPPVEFTLIRKNGIGASDSSVVLGTMAKFRNIEDLLNDKLTLEYTKRDADVADKPVVRMGRDLEPLVLQKAEEQLQIPIHKYPDMLRLTEYPYLTINYDGLMWHNSMAVPVEAKVVSTFGDKYYNFEAPPVYGNLDGKSIAEASKLIGIPEYYYVQVQHQLLGTNADYAYLAALRMKTWSVTLFRVPQNEEVQNKIITEGYSFWRRVERNRS